MRVLYIYVGKRAQFSVQGAWLLEECSAPEEALSGGARTSANNVSLIPFDGVSVRVLGQGRGVGWPGGLPRAQHLNLSWACTLIPPDTPSNGMRLTLLALAFTPPDDASSSPGRSTKRQTPWTENWAHSPHIYIYTKLSLGIHKPPLTKCKLGTINNICSFNFT